MIIMFKRKFKTAKSSKVWVFFQNGTESFFFQSKLLRTYLNKESLLWNISKLSPVCRARKGFFEMMELSPNLLMMEVSGNLGIPLLMKGKVSG